MTAVTTKRGLTVTAGFLVTVLVGVYIPLLLLLVAPVAVGDGAGAPYDLFITPVGFVGAALVWLFVVAGGMWLGIRHPERSFFRGAFLGSFIIVGCVVILLMARVLGKLG